MPFEPECKIRVQCLGCQLFLGFQKPLSQEIRMFFGGPQSPFDVGGSLAPKRTIILMGIYWGIMENQMENNMENEMETTIVVEYS